MFMTSSKKKKVALSVFAVTMATAGIVPALQQEGGILSPIKAHAETFGDFRYVNNGDGTATITGYSYSGSKDVVIPNEINGLTVTGIGDKAFSYINLTSVTIPESVKTIGAYAFQNNSATYKITSLTIPEGVTSIGESAFSGNAIADLTLPNNIKFIGGRAFSSNKLTSLTIPEGITSISENAFSSNKIANLTLPNSLETIGESAFKDNKITSLIIPEGVTSIGESAFSYNLLTSVTIPGSLKTIGSEVFKANKLTSVTIPEGVTSIGKSAFSYNLIADLTLPSSLENIEDNAFESNKFTSIYIPGNIKKVGPSAFVTNLLNIVKIESPFTKIDSSAFDGNQTPAYNLVIYAPSQSIAKTFGQTKGFTVMDYPKEGDTSGTIGGEAGNGTDLGSGSTETPPPTGNENTSNDSDNLSDSSPVENVSVEQQSQFNLDGGGLDLDISPITPFGDLKIPADTTTFNTSFENEFHVKDLRGTGEGWRLDVSATPFTEVTPEGGFAEGSQALVLPIGTLAINPAENIERVGEGTSGLPSSVLTGNTVIDDGTVTVIRADKGNGMGVYKISFPKDALALTLNPSTLKVDKVNYPDKKTPFESTIKWDLIQAP